MNTGARLGAYGAALALVFGATYVAADAVIPQSTVDTWTKKATAHTMSTDHASSGHSGTPAADAHAGHGTSATAAVPGVTSAQNGFVLTPVTAPGIVGESGTLSFAITGPGGHPVTDYVTSHEKQLHLIVVRTDGTQFRHVHPTLGADGTWSLPWTWAEAGTYRVYADFAPSGGQALTLTRTIEVAGTLAPATAQVTRTATVDGFTVSLRGDLSAGTTEKLTFTVTRDGAPVTALEPYLGAFGHLVALREGDLAFLHVHPDGDEPKAGQLSGPEVGFATTAPTAGRYFLYLDFQVEGTVRTAAFVLDAPAAMAHGQSADHPSEPSDPVETTPSTDDHSSH